MLAGRFRSRRFAALVVAASLVDACGLAANDLDWCRRHGAELQELGKSLDVDYSALNAAAFERVPPDANQADGEAAYWAAMEANVTYRSLCREATARRQGLENWTAPPAPTRTPPHGGRP
jgi:hypothetical protein